MAVERFVTLPPRARALKSFVLTSVVAFREYGADQGGSMWSQPVEGWGWEILTGRVSWRTLLADWHLPLGNKEARVKKPIVWVKCLPSCSLAIDPRMLQGTQDSKYHAGLWWRRKVSC